MKTPEYLKTIDEALKTVRKVTNVHDEVMNNNKCQLMLAAKKLLFVSAPPNGVEPPNGWEKKDFNIGVNLPYKQRLIQAIIFLCREIDRIESLEKHLTPETAEKLLTTKRQAK